MKTMLIASALLIGGAAFAQADPRDAGQPIGSGNELQPGTTMGERDTHGTNIPPAPPYNGTAGTTAAPMMNSPATTMGSPAPATSAPDAMSAPANTGTTGSGVIVVQQGGNMYPPHPPLDGYPPCTRERTDHCTQTYVRTGRPAPRNR